MNKINRAFSLIEILVGLAVSAAIFVIVTTLVVNIFSSSVKGRQNEMLEQVKNDLSAEFGNSVRWADSISYVSGLLQIDSTDYRLKNGRLFKGTQALTPEEVEITNFVVTEFEAPRVRSGPGTGLTTQYFNNENMTNLVFTQEDFLVDFDWGEGSPDKLIDPDTFSIRFTGEIEAPVSGAYSFYVASDDGARLWVDNDLVIDDWSIAGYYEASGSINLNSGRHDIRLDFVENFGPARVSLFWKYPGQKKEIIPTVNLYPKSGPVSIKIVVEMKVRGSGSQTDSLSLTLSPRSGNISTIE